MLKTVVSSSPLDLARSTLERSFGYSDFRKPQKPAIESVLSGKDTLVVLPTGGGKSLCYQVPALMRRGLTLVISPLISLMKDQVDALERRGLPATFINSTLGVSEVSERLARVRSGELKLLYLAPERMDSTRTIDRLVESDVSLLAVDEAHCISEWGHDFRPSYRRLGQVRSFLGDPQTVALTATATPSVRSDIVKQLRLEDPTIVVGGFDRKNLSYHVVPTRTQADKDKAAIAAIDKYDGNAIVYAPTRKAVERVTQSLLKARVSAVAYHAGLDEEHRRRAQDSFMTESTRVIVATNAFGMGIDKSDVRLIIHHAMPGSLESYYQEAGRAGRDGLDSTCILLHAYQDRFTHEYFIDGSHPDRNTIESVWRFLRNRCDRDGLVSTPTSDIAPNVGERHVAAALRVLARHGIIAIEAQSGYRVFVRLIATAERITKELGGRRQYDREVLRALWRAVGRSIETGASIDLDGLPPGFGGSLGLTPILDRLQQEQFIVWNRTGGGVRLSPEAIVANRLDLDWESLKARRAVDMDRLDAVQGYAQTKGCRRAFVLRYFGDPDVRPECGACDRCLGSTISSPARSSSRRKRGSSE